MNFVPCVIAKCSSVASKYSVRVATLWTLNGLICYPECILRFVDMIWHVNASESGERYVLRLQAFIPPMSPSQCTVLREARFSTESCDIFRSLWTYLTCENNYAS
jgi:hypothetical protein